MRFARLEQWLDWQQTLHPKAIDMSLRRMTEVAVRAGIDEDNLRSLTHKTITVAGTNGKGSCVRTLEQLLLAQGLSVGAFTSPHILRYNERIRINGAEACDDDILSAFAALDEARGSLSLTYFEFATLAAAWLFKKHQVDYWLLEVGMGGRLDSVNIWSADVAVITSIGIDHVAWLGDNRETIGAEKSGIFRPRQLAVCADLDPPQSIKTKAAEQNVQLTQAGVDFHWRDAPDGWLWWQQGRAAETLHLPKPKLPEPSVAAALQALSLIHKLPSAEQTQYVLEQLTLAGRFQTQTFGYTHFVFDVGHNPDAINLLATKLVAYRPQQKRMAIFAVMEDKDHAGIIAPLLPLIDHWYLPEIPVDRSAAPSTIAQALAVSNAKSTLCADMEAALESATADEPDATVVVFGSFHTIEACMLSEYLKPFRDQSNV